jgi:hypothetical protein
VRVSERDRAFLVSAAIHIGTLVLLLSTHWPGMNRTHARDVDLGEAATVDKRHTVWLVVAAEPSAKGDSAAAGKGPHQRGPAL